MDAPPQNQECPKKGWEWYVHLNYIAKKRGANTFYRTKSQINDMVGKLVLHEKFNERLKEEKKKHGKNFRYMPTHLKEMREEALEKGKIITEIWKLAYNDIHEEPTLTRKSSKKVDGIRTEQIWTVEPIDESYDLLFQLHEENNHCNGSDMCRIIESDQLFSFPRELIVKFPFYCPQCRSSLITREKKKEKKTK